MIRIAVIDDEKEIREYLVSLIKKAGNEIEVAAFASPKAFLETGKDFDVLFLDIEMQGMSGMELAQHIRNSPRKQPIIIFVTGYENYVFDAFDVGAFHYLLKPVNEEKAAQVLKRAVQSIQGKKEQVLHIRFGGVSKTISTADIYYMESFNHKIRIHTADQEIEYYARIGELEEMLKGTFFRIHKGYLINLAYVDRYTKTEVVLTNGVRLLISKYKYDDFTKAYLKFMED